MKKMMKKIARALGTLCGKIRYKKFKPFKLEKGKLLNDELFEKVNDKYNIYLSKKYLEEQNKKEKEEEKSNIELAVKRYLGNTITSENFKEYEELIEKMYKNELEDDVFTFIQNNGNLPLESRFNLLKQFIDRNLDSDNSNNIKNTDELTISEMIVKFLSDVNVKSDSNSDKIKEINDLMVKLEKINDEKYINDLKEWFTDYNSTLPEYKCDALIEEMKTILDEVERRKEKEKINSIISELNTKKENIKNEIIAATTIEELENLTTKINDLFEEGSKYNIIKANECSELLKMISNKSKELSKKEEFVVESFEDYNKNNISESKEVKHEKINNETQKQIKNVMKDIRTALIADGKELSVENCAKAASLFGANKELFDEETERLFNSLIIKAFVKIEENKQKEEEARIDEENARIAEEEARIAEEKRKKILKDKKIVLVAMRKASEALTKVSYNKAKELFYDNIELFNKDEKDKCRITLSKIEYKINKKMQNRKKQKELTM